MDTSPEYVKMCDCVEIQGQRPPWRPGDFVVPVKPSPPCDRVLVLDGYAVPKRGGSLGWYIPECESCIDAERFIWLPRQDQLQEMFGCEGVDWATSRIVERI